MRKARVRPNAGLTLIELLLAVMLMGLISVALAQTFSVGADSYRSGRRALRGIGEMRAATHAFVEAARSMRPDAVRVKLGSAAGGSSVQFLRHSRAGLEENGFRQAAESRGTWRFRREWPPQKDFDAGGPDFPLARGIGGASVEFLLPTRRWTERWPVSSTADTVPRLVRMRLRRSDGRVFESAAYVRVDPESLILAADTATGSDT